MTVGEVTWVGRCRCKTGVALVLPNIEVRKVWGKHTIAFDSLTGEPVGDKRRALCGTCNAITIVTRVAGTYRPGRVCDSRCTEATSAVCSCQCGGANHGRAHAKLS